MIQFSLCLCIYTHIHTHINSFQILFPYRLLQNTEDSSLYSTADLCWFPGMPNNWMKEFLGKAYCCSRVLGGANAGVHSRYLSGRVGLRGGVPLKEYIWTGTEEESPGTHDCLQIQLQGVWSLACSPALFGQLPLLQLGLCSIFFFFN